MSSGDPNKSNYGQGGVKAFELSLQPQLVWPIKCYSNGMIFKLFQPVKTSLQTILELARCVSVNPAICKTSP